MDLAALFATLQTDVLDAIGDAAPVALVVGGSLIALRVGWRVFKGFAR